MDERRDVGDAAESESGPLDAGVDAAVEEAEPYFPPTDPVVRLDREGRPQIASGFGSSETGRTPSTSDEALEDFVHRQLRLDASTAHLQLKVGVRQGTVRLQGPIEDEEDAENALAVAGDVPGVVEVIDEMTRTE